jgi:hypothetical protein
MVDSSVSARATGCAPLAQYWPCLVLLDEGIKDLNDAGLWRLLPQQNYKCKMDIIGEARLLTGMYR